MNVMLKSSAKSYLFFFADIHFSLKAAQQIISAILLTQLQGEQNRSRQKVNWPRVAFESNSVKKTRKKYQNSN